MIESNWGWKYHLSPIDIYTYTPIPKYTLSDNNGFKLYNKN